MTIELKTAYHWDPVTRVFSGTSEVPPSPEEPDVYYAPGDGTFDPVPPEATGYARVRSADNRAWVQVIDLRGTTYWLADGSKHTIDNVGDVWPDGALAEFPRWLEVQRWARAELQRNDAVFVRSQKESTGYPDAWRAYDEALREIVRAESGDPDAPRPTRPAYPTGT